MIRIIDTALSNVAAFRATGKVGKSDYENVVKPAIAELARTQDKLNVILVLDTDLSDFTIAALLEDLEGGLKHFTKWHKIAVVSQSKAINKFTNLLSYLAPGEAKGFKHVQMDEVLNWVCT